MDPTKSFKNRIFEIINERKSVTAKEIESSLHISKGALFKHLKRLIESNSVEKVGRPPAVFYRPVEQTTQKTLQGKASIIDKKLRGFVEDNFLFVTPSGMIKKGYDGFVYWAERTKQPIVKVAAEYYQTLQKYNAFKKDGIVDGFKKMKSTFPKVYLDKLFYLDFYSIEHFGKTKLGQMLLYAKQSQDKRIISDLIEVIKPNIQRIIEENNIDAVGFIPPTVKREVQFMNELDRNLKLKTREIQIIKLRGELTVPQKTLNKLQDRIENAKNTFGVVDVGKYGNILLIDDAVGSGATLNEIAAQIRAKNITEGEIIGLAITGSYKGFEVISEV